MENKGSRSVPHSEKLSPISVDSPWLCRVLYGCGEQWFLICFTQGETVPHQCGPSLAMSCFILMWRTRILDVLHTGRNCPPPHQCGQSLAMSCFIRIINRINNAQMFLVSTWLTVFLKKWTFHTHTLTAEFWGQDYICHWSVVSHSHWRCCADGACKRLNRGISGVTWNRHIVLAPWGPAGLSPPCGQLLAVLLIVIFTNMYIARARCECRTAVGSSGLNARWS